MAAMAMPAPAAAETPEEFTQDNPQSRAAAKEEQRAKDDQEKKEENALLEIRKTFKVSWTTKRQAVIRRILRSFEYLKGNPYGVMNYGTQEMNPIADVIAGTKKADDPKLFQFNDNVFQMLALSFIAALSPDVPKVRWMPDDPQDESDLAFSKKASTMMAFIERKNDMPSLQSLELLYLWCAGTYFSYTRNLVDAVRAGTTKTPVMEMRSQEVLPDRYLCMGCGSPNPASQYNPFVSPTCFDCHTPLHQKDFYPAENMDMPVQVGEDEQANSFTAIDIYCGLNIDTDPDCEKLSEAPLLDLVAEMTPAAVRARYPGRYKEIAAGQFGDDTTNTTMERNAREAVSSPTNGKRGAQSIATRGTFSRCWIQPDSFSSLDDEEMAKTLISKYPKGVKIVSYGSLVLEKRPESLNDHWTECRTLKGMGMYPFAVGDVAISVQDRLDDTANNIHIYQDRMALPPILANANIVDVNAMNGNAWGGGRAIPVYPSLKMPGQRYTLSEALFQPTFHADSQIYGYSQTLIQLMQLLTGVQPQIFGGGTTRGVDTAQGQEQMLNTAMGRLMLFLQAMRSEHAIRAKLAVKCMAADIDDQQRITIEGKVEGEYENVFVLQSEVQGEIHAYPQADQGFPASYGEMRDRLIQLLGMVENNPVLTNMLSDPDMQKLFALYLLPDGAKLPGDSERTKIKMVLEQLAKAHPIMLNGMAMPSIQPDPDCDDLAMIVTITKDWMQSNYEMATSNPNGYANARAYLKLASMIAEQSQAKQAALQAAASGPAKPAMPQAA